MKWAELSQHEFVPAIEKTEKLCIVPVGCFEMHGEHLPVSTDVMEAEAISVLAAEIEPACVFPAFQFGDVCGLYNWKGSVVLEPTMMLKLLENYCGEIARTGFDKIVLMNFHGGNTSFLGYFTRALAYEKREYTVLQISPYQQEKTSFAYIHKMIQENGVGYYPELEPEDAETIRIFIEEEKIDGHGGLQETCLMLAIRPDLVHLERMSDVSGLPTHKADKLYEAGFGEPLWHINFPNSYGGHDPVGASARIGKLLLRLNAEVVANACKVFKEEYGVLKETREHIDSFRM